MSEKITTGYPLPDPGSGNHPTPTGYRPGAAQDTVVPDNGHPGRRPHQRGWPRIVNRVAATTPHQWAETRYVATSTPTDVLDRDPRLAGRLTWAASHAQPAVRAAMRPIPVADTVTVAGHAPACARTGWAAMPDPGRPNRKDPG